MLRQWYIKSMVGIIELGMLFIGFGWFVQVFDITKKEVKLNKQFVLLYVLGLGLVLVGQLLDSFRLSPSLILNLFAFLGALIVYFKLK